MTTVRGRVRKVPQADGGGISLFWKDFWRAGAPLLVSFQAKRWKRPQVSLRALSGGSPPDPAGLLSPTLCQRGSDSCSSAKLGGAVRRACDRRLL